MCFRRSHVEAFPIIIWAQCLAPFLGNHVYSHTLRRFLHLMTFILIKTYVPEHLGKIKDIFLLVL